MSEGGVGAIFEALGAGIPTPEGVTTTTTTITGSDGNDITLFVSRPTDAAEVLPGVVHLHGGGMAIGSAADLSYIRLREYLAATGLVVVGVEFRNSGGKLGPHPYPAGLNDCASAARWISAHRGELGIGRLIVSGESGGGNLTLTLAHKAKRGGWIDEVAGFYAQCPFISNRWAEVCEDLPSLAENDGYFISCEQLALLGSLYDPDREHSQDPACWAAWQAGDHAGAEAAYAAFLPAATFGMQSLEVLACYGKRVFGLRAGIAIHDRAPAMRPDAFGLAMAAKWAAT